MPSAERTFVSILHVIDAVKVHVGTGELEAQLSADEQHQAEAYQARYIDSFGLSLRNSWATHMRAQVLDARRIAKAAGALHFFLKDASNQKPRWFDWGLTGWPCLSTEAESIGMQALLSLTSYDQRCLNVWSSVNVNEFRRLHTLPSPPHLFEDDAAKGRLQCVGFERTELIQFLDHYAIPQRREMLVGIVLSVIPEAFPPDAQDLQCIAPEKDSDAPHSLADPLVGRKEGLSTKQLCAAFGDQSEDRYKTGRTRVQWENYLGKSPPGWAQRQGVRTSPGRQGRGYSTLWDPFEFAKQFLSGRSDPQIRNALSERFRKVASLSPWSNEWEAYVEENFRWPSGD